MRRGERGERGVSGLKVTGGCEGGEGSSVVVGVDEEESGMTKPNPEPAIRGDCSGNR